MKFYIANPVLDAQIAEIRRKIRLSMNGVVSEQMTQSGIEYKKNYGVSIPRLREMARAYAPSHDLAQRLWHIGYRETMILATLLQPVDKFTTEIAYRWAAEFNHTEMVEQTCMNLFSRLPYADTLCGEFVQSDRLWIRIAGFVLAARVVPQLNQELVYRITEKALQISVTTDLHLYKAIALCLSRICRKDRETATYILKQIEFFSESEHVAQLYISNEVKQEILFLGIL
jgi:3-methyladenine DNA glycosylase AlkD